MSPFTKSLHYEEQGSTVQTDFLLTHYAVSLHDKLQEQITALRSDTTRTVYYEKLPKLSVIENSEIVQQTLECHETQKTSIKRGIFINQLTTGSGVCAQYSRMPRKSLALSELFPCINFKSRADAPGLSPERSASTICTSKIFLVDSSWHRMKSLPTYGKHAFPSHKISSLRIQVSNETL